MTDAVTTSPTDGVDRRRALRVGREVALWAGAIIGVFCLVLTVLGALFDVRPVVFRSGSMEPTIGTGALAFTRTVPAADLEVGDVVTVRTAEGVRVTHRIRSISPNGEQVTLVLKGDANEVVDADPYVVSTADRVLFSMPRAGYVVDALGSRTATFAGGILVGLLLVTAFGRRRRDETPVVVETASAGTTDVPAVAAGVSRPVPGRRRPALAVAIGVAAAVVLVAGAKGTSAYFTDSATVNTGTFTAKAGVVPPNPIIKTCGGGNGASNPYTLTFDWPTAANATNPNGGFKLYYENLVGSVSGSNPVSIAATARTYTTVNMNSVSGQMRLVAIVDGVESTGAIRNFVANGPKSCTAP